MITTISMTLLAAFLAQTPAAQPAPQAPDRRTQAGSAQATYGGVRGFILRSAEKMPAEQFTFQPTPDVRSFGQILAHIADANHLLCSPAAGVTSANGDVVDKIEKEKLGREALLVRLRDSFTVCDKAYAALSETNVGETLTFMTTTRPRLALLWFHISHAFEHYGNLVTYMRLKGIVPPSSEK